MASAACMAGPRVLMYALKPIYESNPVIELPSCMYKMAPIYSNKADNSKDMDGLKQLEEQQDKILQRLSDLKKQVESLKQSVQTSRSIVTEPDSPESPVTKSSLNFFQDIVVSAHPGHPPLSLWVLRRLLKSQMKVALTTYVHSTVGSLPPDMQQLEVDEIKDLRMKYNLVITLIWKEVKKDPVMMVSPVFQAAIEGEVNIARYLARLMQPSYDEGDAVSVTLIDHWLELSYSSLIHGHNRDRQAALKAMNVALGSSTYLAGNELSLADIVMWSSLLQTKVHCDLPANVKRWWQALNNMPLFALPSGFKV